MSTRPPVLRQGTDSDSLFARHPAATISVLLAVFLAFFLGCLELFLRTFSGLGNPPLYELSPLYGYRLKPNQTVAPRGGISSLYGAPLHINNLGLRAAGDWDGNPEGKVLFLGDSVTYGGQYVADAQLFSSVAANMLPGRQVGNGGVNGWGVGNIVGLVKWYGFSPAEVVATCLIEGDFYRGTVRAASMPLWQERPALALEDLLMHLVWSVNQLRYGDAGDALVAEEDHLDRIVEEAGWHLRDLDDYYRRQRVRHFLFILPSRSQLADGEPRDPRVEAVLKKHALHAEYLLPRLLVQEPDRGKRRKWFHDEVHLEPAGHRAYGALIGEILAKALAAEGGVP